jgi:hypothetical protein
LFHFSYLITLMVYLCSQWTQTVQIKYFVFDSSIYRLFILKTMLETRLFPNYDIRICLQDMKISWTKKAFSHVYNTKWRKWCKFDSPLLFNNTYGLPVLTMDTKCSNQVFYVWLDDLQTIWAKIMAGNLTISKSWYSYIFAWHVSLLN